MAFETVQHRCDVITDGRDREVELVGDRARAATVAEQLEHLPLPRRERRLVYDTAHRAARGVAFTVCASLLSVAGMQRKCGSAPASEHDQN